MGSIKEVESSFGEQSARLAPKPPTRRLSWFEARFPHHPSIQEVAFRAGAAVLSLTGLSAMNPPEFNPLSLTARTALAQAASLAEQPAENLPLLERLLIGQSPTVELSIDGTDGETHLIQAFNTADCEVFIKSAEPTIPISSSFQNRPNPIPDAVRDAFTQASKAGGFKDSRIVLTPNLIPSESQPYPVIVDMPGLDKTSYQIQRSINTRPDGVSSLDVIFTLPQLIIDKLKIDSLFKDVFLQSLAFQYGAIVASGGNPQAMPDILTIEQQKAAGTITRFVRDFLSVETITPAPPETSNNALKLNYKSPQGFLEIDNYHAENPTQQLTHGFKLSDPKSEAEGDEFLGRHSIHVPFVRNPNLKTARLGSYSIYLDPEGKQRFAVLRPVVSIEDRTIRMEYNFLMPDVKVTPEFLAEHSRLISGSIGAEMAKIVFGKSIDEAETQEERNKLGQLMLKLNEIVLVQMIAPTF